MSKYKVRITILQYCQWARVRTRCLKEINSSYDTSSLFVSLDMLFTDRLVLERSKAVSYLGYQDYSFKKKISASKVALSFVEYSNLGYINRTRIENLRLLRKA